MPTHLVLAPLPYMMSLQTLPTVSLTYKVQSTPNKVGDIEIQRTQPHNAQPPSHGQIHNLKTS